MLFTAGSTAPINSDFHLAFNLAVTDIKTIRDQEVTPFDVAVSASMHQTVEKAIEDRFSDTAVYRVLSAPTGSGKSTYAIAAMKAVVETIPDGSCLFLCETMEQLDDVYREAVTIIPAEHVGVFSTAHDVRNPPEVIERDYGFTPSFQMSRKDLAFKRVLLVTHNFYRDKNGHMAMNYNGKPRTITFIDERPNEVTIFEVSPSDVVTVRDALAKACGVHFNGVAAADALHKYLDLVWKDEAPPECNFFGVDLPKDAAWFVSPECEEVLKRGDLRVYDHDCLTRVVGLARSMMQGYAFSSQYTQGRKGCVFVGYDMDMPIMPGTVVLDATADLDGISTLAPWRHHTPVPSVTFENLTVTHIGIPKEIVGRNESWSTITGNRRRAKPYGEWLMREVERHTQPGEKVLVVAHKGIVENGYVPADHRTFQQAYDLNGRKVCFIHWGAGVGSNRWQDADSVFLFGEFVIPRRVIVGQALGYTSKEATQSTLQPFQLPNSEAEDFVTLRDGHLDRWLKQLAMRGKARQLSPEGKCGEQRLFITADYERVHGHLDVLFPKAVLVRDETSENNGLSKGGKEGVITLLRTSKARTLDVHEVKARCGVDLVKNGGIYLRSEPVIAAMEAHGWQWVKGRGGRGSITPHFIRIPGAEDFGFKDETVVDRLAYAEGFSG